MNDANVPPSTTEDVDAIKEYLLATFRKALGQQDFKADEGFLASGSDSLTVVETILEIEERYGVTLSAAEFMALDTAENLAQHIAPELEGHKPQNSDANDISTSESTFLSAVQNGESAHPLICTYGVHGEAAYAIKMAGLLPVDQPVATLQIRPKVALGATGQSFRELEKDSATTIRDRYPNRSSVLMGFSLGAHVALAIGHELTRCGSFPAFIAVLDDEADLERRHFGALRQSVEPENIIDALGQTLRCSPAEPIAARLVYFRSAEDDAYFRSDPTSGWGEIATGGVTCVDVTANHLEFSREHGLRQIVPKILEEMAIPFQQAPRPSAAQMLRFEARRAARKGNLSSELKFLTRAIEQDTEQPAWVYANLAEALFQKGETATALGALSKARLQENWQLSLDLRFLDTIQAKGLEAERNDILRRLSTVTADHPSVHEQKAQAFFELGLWEDSQAEVKAGLAIHPQHLRLSHLLVRNLRQRGVWPELVEVANRLIEIFPYEKKFRTVLIVAYTKAGTPDLALRLRDAIVAESLPDVFGLMALGDAFFHCGRFADALEIANLAGQAAPQRPRPHFLRCTCLQSLGRHEEAAAAKRHAQYLRATMAKSDIARRQGFSERARVFIGETLARLGGRFRR